MGKENNVFRERNCTWKDLWHYTFLCLRHKRAELTFFLGKRPNAATWWSPRRGHTSDFKAKWNIHIFRSAEGQESDFLLHSLPTPQSREDTVKSHFQRLHTQGALSRSLKLLQIPAWRAVQFPCPRGTGLAQCHQTNPLQEGEEVSSLTAALPPILPAQTKLMLVAYLFITVLPAHSLGCCQRNSERTWSLVLDLVNSHPLSGPKSSKGRLAWILKPVSKLQSTDCLEPGESALSQKVLRVEEEWGVGAAKFDKLILTGC